MQNFTKLCNGKQFVGQNYAKLCKQRQIFAKVWKECKIQNKYTKYTPDTSLKYYCYTAKRKKYFFEKICKLFENIKKLQKYAQSVHN